MTRQDRHLFLGLLWLLLYWTTAFGLFMALVSGHWALAALCLLGWGLALKEGTRHLDRGRWGVVVGDGG